jgi:hypothetical protein
MLTTKKYGCILFYWFVCFIRMWPPQKEMSLKITVWNGSYWWEFLKWAGKSHLLFRCVHHFFFFFFFNTYIRLCIKYYKLFDQWKCYNVSYIHTYIHTHTQTFSAILLFELKALLHYQTELLPLELYTLFFPELFKVKLQNRVPPKTLSVFLLIIGIFSYVTVQISI